MIKMKVTTHVPELEQEHHKFEAQAEAVVLVQRYDNGLDVDFKHVSVSVDGVRDVKIDLPTTAYERMEADAKRRAKEEGI